jgi:tRNA (guanosine-2'-O-)-methyltransferase
MLDETAKSVYEIDLTGKIVILMGNEHRGVSEEAAEKADEKIYIPMRGMIQSLNVSVAAAVTLFEAQRQRSEKGMYNKSELTEEKIENIIDQWADK